MNYKKKLEAQILEYKDEEERFSLVNLLNHLK